MQASSYRECARGRNAFFVTTAYEVGSQGQSRCRVPTYCPLGSAGTACSVRIHGRRERKTGPRHALLVAYCSCHKRYFTLYPPGYVPYSRAKVVPAEAPRERLEGGREGGLEPWRATWFGDIVRLAEGEGLPRGSLGGELETRQVRRTLKRGARLTGLTGGEAVAEKVAADLEVPLHRVYEASRRMRMVRSWRGQARAVGQVLSAVSPSPGRLARVLRAGARTGLWPPPWKWTGNRYQVLF